jgi:hypothetical protein
MNHKSSGLAAFVLIVFALTYLSFNCVGRKAESRIPDITGRAIVAYTENVVLLDSAQNLIDPSNFSGDIFLLEFYTADCPPCEKRMSALRKLAGTVYMKSPLTLVRINSGGDDAFEKFAADIQRRDFQLYDAGGVLTRNLQIEKFPSSVLVDSDGMIRHFSMGEETEDVDLFIEESRLRIDSLLDDISARSSHRP